MRKIESSQAVAMVGSIFAFLLLFPASGTSTQIKFNHAVQLAVARTNDARSEPHRAAFEAASEYLDLVTLHLQEEVVKERVYWAEQSVNVMSHRVFESIDHADSLTKAKLALTRATLRLSQIQSLERCS